MINSMKTLGVLAALALAPVGAQAATTGAFDVTAAVSDRDGKALSLWFNSVLSTGFDRVYSMATPGTFVADAIGAVMTGSVVNALNDAAGFDFNFEYDRTFLQGGPSDQNFKAVWEDVHEHGNEEYFDFERGTVTGTGGLEGLVFEMVRAPADGEYVTQMGGGMSDLIGANQHNNNFGLSGWMEIASVSVDMDACDLCVFDEAFYTGLAGTQSDVNVDLSPAQVPVPAAGLMLMAAVGGVGAFARRRRKS